MKLLVNAISVRNQSGRLVLGGHLSELIKARSDNNAVRLVIVIKEGDDWIANDIMRHSTLLTAPRITNNYLARVAWEKFMIPKLCVKHAVDAYFTPSGISAGNLPIPEIVLAQNPWCFVQSIHNSLADQIKAAIQRRKYSKTMKDAEVILFNSRYMQESYRANSKCKERNGMIAYNGVSELIYEEALKRKNIQRISNKIISVSSMAPHKGCEMLIDALELLADKHKIYSEVYLIGSWPDAKYKAKIDKKVNKSKLKSKIHFCGHVSFKELMEHYATAKIFALISRCESFGIPAIEAQAFGIPVIVSNQCAMPEVNGEGGFYCSPINSEKVADHIRNLLSDRQLWERTSDKARRNSERFHWNIVSRPLIQAIDSLDVN